MHKDFKRRYAANMSLEGFDQQVQTKLCDSHILIVGAGALGSTAAMYAAGSGIGHISLIDFDTIDLSNLQRQVFFTEAAAGEKKAASLATSIRGLNPNCEVTVYDELFSAGNADRVCRDIHLIIDSADNPSTTYLIERVAEELKIPYITAGVSGWKAQIMTHYPGDVNFSDLFPAPDSDAGMLPCSIAGVSGPLTGVVASLEAAEAVKVLANVGTPLSNRLLTIDLYNLDFSLLEVR